MARRAKAMGKSGKGRKKPASVAKRVPRTIAGGPDGSMLAYANLLRDPCNAPLTHAPYGSNANGYLLRAEWDGMTSTSPSGNVCSFGAFIPGFVTTATALTGINSGLLTEDGLVALVSDTTTTNLVPVRDAQPGYAFLTASANRVRAVAACLQIEYVGSEQNRSGIISVGQTTAGALVGVNSAAKMRALCCRTTRTPDGVVEIKLRPTDDNAYWFDPAVSTNLISHTGQIPALCYSATGLPAGAGIRLKLTTVYEWEPEFTSGLQGRVQPTPNFTLASAVNALQRTGEWWYNVSTGAARPLLHWWLESARATSSRAALASSCSRDVTCP